MIRYIPDTDHVSLHQDNHPQVIARMKAYPPDELAITAVTVEEQTRGRLAQIGQPGGDLSLAYDLLRATVDYFCGLTILSFGPLDQQQYQKLRLQKIRIGTLDLRIAAITLCHEAILLTRNRRDFEQVTDLQIEDWSR